MTPQELNISSVVAARWVRPNSELDDLTAQIGRIGTKLFPPRGIALLSPGGRRADPLERAVMGDHEEVTKPAITVYDRLDLTHYAVFDHASEENNEQLSKVWNGIGRSKKLARILLGITTSFEMINPTNVPLRLDMVGVSTRPEFASLGEEISLIPKESIALDYLREVDDAILRFARYNGPTIYRPSRDAHSPDKQVPIARLPPGTNSATKDAFIDMLEQCLPDEGVPARLNGLLWQIKLSPAESDM